MENLFTLRRRVGGIARRAPLTLSLFAVIFFTGIIMGTIRRDAFPHVMATFGWDLPALQAGHFYDLWVGILFASKAGSLLSMPGMLLLGVGSLEYTKGSKIAAIGFFLLGPLSSTLSLLLIWPLNHFKFAWVDNFLYVPDMGSSSYSMVCWGLALSNLRALWRNSLTLITFWILVIPLFYTPKPYVADHIVALFLGLSVGLVFIMRQKTGHIASRKSKELHG